MVEKDGKIEDTSATCPVELHHLYSYTLRKTLYVQKRL